MKLTEKYVIETSKNLEDIILNLKEVTDESNFTLFSNKKYFFGKIDNENFWLIKSFYGRGSGNFKIKGNFKKVSNRTQIYIELKFRIIRLLIILLILFSQIYLLIYVNLSSHKSIVFLNGFLGFLLFLFSIIIYIAFKDEKNILKSKLKSIFK